MLDCGLVWKDIDRLPVRDVFLSSNVFKKQNQCRDLCIGIVKASFLILMRLKLKDSKKISLDVMEHVAFGTGPSSIVSVECMHNGENEDQFIIACREGPFHLLTIPSIEVSSATMDVIDISEFFSKSSDGATLDTKNYRCHGLRKSKNSSVWVFLQNGLLDEQVKFTKGKLTFLTQKTFATISKTIIEKCKQEFGFCIPKSKDILEIFRILACYEAKVKVNGDSFSDMLMNLIKNDTKRRKQNGTLELERMQIYLWICQLYGNISNSDEIILSWDSLAEELHRDILCLHAQRILRLYISSDPGLNSAIYDKESISSLRSFYVNFGKPDMDELDKLKIPKYQWKCKFCDLNEELETHEDSYVDCFYCTEKHHKWPRCVLTLMPCDDKNLLKCKWCESVTLKHNFKNDPNLNCSLCHGPFTSL